MTIDDLLEIEAIKAVKYRYMRGIDTRDWDLVATTLTEDATSAYNSGEFSHEGRDAIIAFLRMAMPAGDALSSHQVHHPEIELSGPDTATARWAIHDYVIRQSAGRVVQGAAYYEDRLRKVGGEWRIEHTGYRRLYMETQKREVVVNEHWWKTEPPGTR